MKISINENAPVVEKQQTFIPVAPEIIWQVISNINDWPKWQSDVTKAKIMGPLQEGTVFKWKAGGVNFTSKLHTVLKNKSIGWIGKTFGAKAIHNWFLEPKDGGTIVYVEESLQGLLPSLMKSKFSQILQEGMAKNLSELVAVCSSK